MTGLTMIAKLMRLFCRLGFHFPKPVVTFKPPLLPNTVIWTRCRWCYRMETRLPETKR